MTNIYEGHPFFLQPPEHWQEVARATRANIKALREQRQKEIKGVCDCSPEEYHEKTRKIHELHDSIERQMGIGLTRAIQMHQRHVQKANHHPRAQEFMWSRSDPPGTSNKDSIDPRHPDSPHHSAYVQKRLGQTGVRKPQVYQGRHLRFT
jgi:hypothetical protein